LRLRATGKLKQCVKRYRELNVGEIDHPATAATNLRSKARLYRRNICLQAKPINGGIMTGRKIRLLVLSLAAFGVACAGLPRHAAAFSGRISIESGGHTRSALIIEHRRLKKDRRMLVVVLHGGKDHGARIRRALGLERDMRSAGPVFVYPDTPGGKWNVSPGMAAEHDSLFVRDLIAKLVADGIVDQHKIFLVGSASGGSMALKLACEHSDLFAGAAILLKKPPEHLVENCHLTHPMGFLLITHTQHTTHQVSKATPAGTSPPLSPTEQTLAAFAKAADCGPRKAIAEFPHHGSRKVPHAIFERYEGCKAPVEFAHIPRGGHVISKGKKASERGGKAFHNSDLNTAALIWNLFRKTGG
jgi:polyhydroxybutyrate depolymerase